MRRLPSDSFKPVDAAETPFRRRHAELLDRASEPLFDLLGGGQPKRPIRGVPCVADLHPRSGERQQQSEAADYLNNRAAERVLDVGKLLAGYTRGLPSPRLPFWD